MKRTAQEVRLLRRYRQLQREWRRVVKRYPEVDPDNVWHTLVCLEMNPLERLRRGLIRARSFDFRKA